MEGKDVVVLNAKDRAALLFQLAGDVEGAELGMVQHLKQGFSQNLLDEVGGNTEMAAACVVSAMREIVIYKVESVEKVLASGGTATLNKAEREVLRELRAFLQAVPQLDVGEPLHPTSCPAVDTIICVRAFSATLRASVRGILTAQGRRNGGMVFLKSA